MLELLEESRDLARVLESMNPAEKVEVLIGDENGISTCASAAW